MKGFGKSFPIKACERQRVNTSKSLILILSHRVNLIVTRARKIYSTAVERTLTAILSITHARICKGMSVKCINPSFINRFGTSILPIMNCRREAKRVTVIIVVIRYLSLMQGYSGENITVWKTTDGVFCGQKRRNNQKENTQEHYFVL